MAIVTAFICVFLSVLSGTVAKENMTQHPSSVSDASVSFSSESIVTSNKMTSGPISATPDLQTNIVPTQYEEINGTSNGTNTTHVTKDGGQGQEAEEEEFVLWREIANYIQLTLAGIGFVANIVVVYTLYREQGIFSHVLSFLLKHQSIMDAIVCLLLVVFQVPPFGWKTHVEWLDYFLCHVWHSQGFFWMFVSLSVQNLVLITIERYLAVCEPLRYMRVRKGHFGYALVGVYIFSLLTSVPPTLFEVRYKDKACVYELAYDTVHMKNFFNAYSIIWYVTNYMIPCIIFIVLYVMIIRVLVKSKKMDKHGSTKTIDKASRQITKMAIIVISIFAVALGFDNSMYMLYYWGHVNYSIGHPIQVAGLLVTTINSVANPFIYTFMLPTFRLSLLKALGCGKKAAPRAETSNTGSTNVPSVAVVSSNARI